MKLAPSIVFNTSFCTPSLIFNAMAKFYSEIFSFGLLLLRSNSKLSRSLRIDSVSRWRRFSNFIIACAILLRLQNDSKTSGRFPERYNVHSPFLPLLNLRPHTLSYSSKLCIPASAIDFSL